MSLVHLITHVERIDWQCASCIEQYVPLLPTAMPVLNSSLRSGDAFGRYPIAQGTWTTAVSEPRELHVTRHVRRELHWERVTSRYTPLCFTVLVASAARAPPAVCVLMQVTPCHLPTPGLCMATPAEALLARSPKCVPPQAVCIMKPDGRRLKSPRDVTSPPWLKVKISRTSCSEPRLRGYTYATKRSQCLKLNFNWQIPKGDWLVYHLCADIN